MVELHVPVLPSRPEEELEADSSSFPAPTNQQESSTTSSSTTDADADADADAGTNNDADTTPAMVGDNHAAAEEEGDKEEVGQNDSLDNWLDEAVSAVSKDELDVHVAENNDDCNTNKNTNNSSSSPSALDFMMGIATSTPEKDIHQKSLMVQQEQDETNMQLCPEKVDGEEEEKKDEDSSGENLVVLNNNNAITDKGGVSDEGKLSAESTESTPEINDISASINQTKDASEDGVDVNASGEISTIPSAPEAEASNETTKVLTDSRNDPIHVAKGDEINEKEAMNSPTSPQNKVHDKNDQTASPSKPAQDTSAPAPQDQQPSSNSTPAKMFRNRFANWKSKAEDALQNPIQVLKIAQKNIEETNKKVQQAVENTQKNIEETNKKVQRAVENNIHIGGLGGVHVGGGDKVGTSISNPGARKIVDPDDVEDDLSYESGGRSIVSEGGSQSSSVYVDSSDDASYSSFSDTSSVYADQSPSRGRIRLGMGNEGSSRSLHSNKSKKKSLSPKNSNSPRRRVFRPPSSSSNSGTTPILKNGVAVVPSATGPSPSPSPVSSYKGRYEAAGQSQSRANILKTLQRKVRVPSPEPPKMREIKPPRKEGKRQESQLELMQRVIPGPMINAILKSMSRGQYLMLLRPGMLGVNLKQTYLSGHGVYVDFLLPGGNAEKSGVVCVGDGLVKVADVDVSKGTILDVPGIIGKSRRPAVLVLNGEHSVKLEDMDYLNVAIGVVNRMLDEACNGMNRSAIDEIPSTSESNSYLMPENPPESLRAQVEGCSSQRYVSVPIYISIGGAPWSLSFLMFRTSLKQKQSKIFFFHCIGGMSTRREPPRNIAPGF